MYSPRKATIRGPDSRRPGEHAIGVKPGAHDQWRTRWTPGCRHMDAVAAPIDAVTA